MKIKRDLEIYRKIQNAKHTSSQKAIDELMQIETSKTSDALKVEYDFDLADLLRSVVK